MRARSLLAVPACSLALLLAAQPASAQLWKKVKKTAEKAAEREGLRQVDKSVTNAVRCAAGDSACIEKARRDGDPVEIVEDDGTVTSDSTAQRPGEGAWANYDFVPGDDVLLYEDFSDDRVGDFPRKLALVQGNFEIVEWRGARQLRATSNGILALPLPSSLPERFTVETAVSLQHGNAFLRVMPGRAYYGPARRYHGSAVSVERTEAGVRPTDGSTGPTVMTRLDAASDAMVPLRIMADGAHMKVYLGERRVANVPNAVFPRSDTLFLAVSSAAEAHPIVIGTIRVAGGGRDLYDRLTRDGRVATHGILFDTDSDILRPESTPTLEEIGRMLVDNPGLRLRIEGHTDAEGDSTYNQRLSEGRAEAVQRYLVARHGIEAARLEAVGLGESAPVATNDTAEGRQENRRVELVRRP